ncbi:MAG: Ig-like domain-containing protein [Thaumarchaeota archaeon]|nr:Ig-like domain-containing protein [Nitrososphaerota archaeon]
MILQTNGRKQRKHHPRRGVAGVLAGLILFAMIFSTGFGYILFVNQGSQSINQANAGRQNAAFQSSQEALISKAVPSGSTLVVSVNNTGGVPATISSIYVVNSTGKLISAFLGPAPDTNISVSMWPISLPVGQSTNSLKDNIKLTGYTYTAGNSVNVEIVTARGNTFGAPYPIPSSIIPPADALVVKMVANPPQTLSCNAPKCVNVTVTVFNYATSPVTAVTLSPSTPAPQVTGTATISGGSCTPPVPNTIPAYSGSGNAPSITFTCHYSALTGSVGGLASFTTSAIGTLGGKGVSSAEATSNYVQIGGSSNVPTQGAFAPSYFFLKFSSCQNPPNGPLGSYTYPSPCTTSPKVMPPASVGGLANGNYISGISDYYVAYYVQVTNNFNASLPLLQYSYLFMDPGISTEAYSFLVGVNNSAFRSNGAYYPNYNPGGGGIPTLTSYASDCNTVNVQNVPVDANCFYVNPGKTVTLTFAACGYSQPNWVWGGTAYGQQLDTNNNCITTAPGYKNAVPEGQTFAIVLSYIYKNQIYSQVMPFQAQTVTNLRATSTAVSCLPSPDPVNAPSTCTATVTDLAGSPITPTGTVTFSQNPANGGTFGGGGGCALSGAGASATCSLTFTPSPGGEGLDKLNATYAGDTNHTPSGGQTSLTATQRATSTAVVCNPPAAVPNTPTNCTIIVSDTSAGTAITPTGSITLTQNSTGTFTPISGTCTLILGTCSVTYTPSSGFIGKVKITAPFLGDFDHTGSSGSTTVSWNNKKLTMTAVSCLPTSFNIDATSQCTATLTGFTAPVTGETVTFSQNGGTGSVTFVTSTCTLSAGGTCSVTIKGLTSGTAFIRASYPGDSQNLASSGQQTVTVNAKHPAVLVQQLTLCTNPGGSSCSKTMNGVTSGDVLVVAVGTLINDGTCVSVSSISGTLGDPSYSAAPGGTASAQYNPGFGNPMPCAYSAIYYATATSSGSDTITVNLNGSPDFGEVIVYDVSSALTPPTAAAGTCTSGSCPLSIVTSTSLPYVANSFLATVGSDCPSSGGNGRNINSGVAGFTADYGPPTTGNHHLWVGHLLSLSSGSQTFQMTSTGGATPPACWSVVGAQFVDPPPPPGWNATVPAQTGPAVSHSASNLFSTEPPMVGMWGIIGLAFVALGCLAFSTILRLGPQKRREEQRRS